MQAKKFELFMGHLGNGTTVCNKAVMEHGDYKTIAHISPAGNITPYEQFSEFTDRFKDEPLEIKYVNLIPLYLKNS